MKRLDACCRLGAVRHTEPATFCLQIWMTVGRSEHKCYWPCDEQSSVYKIQDIFIIRGSDEQNAVNKYLHLSEENTSTEADILTERSNLARLNRNLMTPKRMIIHGRADILFLTLSLEAHPIKPVKPFTSRLTNTYRLKRSTYICPDMFYIAMLHRRSNLAGPEGERRYKRLSIRIIHGRADIILTLSLVEAYSKESRQMRLVVGSKRNLTPSIPLVKLSHIGTRMQKDNEKTASTSSPNNVASK